LKVLAEMDGRCPQGNWHESGSLKDGPFLALPGSARQSFYSPILNKGGDDVD